MVEIRVILWADEEDIQMKQLEGFVISSKEDRVYL
jgi:hypothetical protein